MKVTVENQGQSYEYAIPMRLLKEHLLKVGRVRQITDWMPERFFIRCRYNRAPGTGSDDENKFECQRNDIGYA